MSIRKYMQEEIYDYIWVRDSGDGKSKGKLERMKVDKDEGYEVDWFIESFLKTHNKELSKTNVQAVEDALHHSSLSSIVMRTTLNSKIATKFKLV
jgi:hypothetical protein